MGIKSSRIDGRIMEEREVSAKDRDATMEHEGSGAELHGMTEGRSTRTTSNTFGWNTAEDAGPESIPDYDHADDRSARDRGRLGVCSWSLPRHALTGTAIRWAKQQTCSVGAP